MHQSVIDHVSLRGRRALVTGAGSGIGRAAAIRLGQAGAQVLALDLNAVGLTQTSAAAADTGVLDLQTVVVDVTDSDAVQSALAGHSFDVVVNAAGIMAPMTLPDTSPTAWDRVLATNLTGCFTVLRTVLPLMARPGSVIQVASMQAHVGVGFPAYTATKGALLALSRQLGAELGSQGIRVNSVSPGMIVTGLTEAALADGPRRGQFEQHTPLGRLGQPDDLADAILFLASDMSRFVTATDLLVDGGLISSFTL